MKYIIFYVTAIVLAAKTSTADNSVNKINENQQQSTDELHTAESNLSPLYEKKQEKRYIGGYGTGLEYYNPYSRYLGIDSGSIYNPGYGGYGSYTGLGGYGAGYGGYGAGYGGYGAGYGAGYGGGYGGYGAGYGYNSYSRLGSLGAYPYSRSSYGYSGYPSSYYSGNYGNSIIGGGLGGLGVTGLVPPISAGGYQYGPGISGTIY